jgi:hypothetical protein
MKLVEQYRGFEICQTSAGHLVVLDPRDPQEVREKLFELLANADALDALFFPNLPAARQAIADMIKAEEARGT